VVRVGGRHNVQDVHPTTKPVPEALKAAVWLLVGVGSVAPVVLVLRGLVAAFVDRGGFLGNGGVPDNGRPLPPPPDHSAPWLIAATVTGIAVPVVGILLSIASKQVLPRVFLGVVLAITLLSLAISHLEATPSGDPVDDRPHYCQEHSGGDTTCPGG
jgi:hypothetical protein